MHQHEWINPTLDAELKKGSVPLGHFSTAVCQKCGCGKHYHLKSLRQGSSGLSCRDGLYSRDTNFLIAPGKPLHSSTEEGP